jgi:hypothetical protein
MAMSFQSQVEPEIPAYEVGQCEDALALNVPELNFGQRVGNYAYGIGSRCVEATKNTFENVSNAFESRQSKALAVGLGGVLAVVGALETKDLTTPESAAATVAKSKTIYRSSNLKLQPILNGMHDALSSGDFGQGRYRVLPKSAYLRASSGGFRTDCRSPNVVTFRYYKITPYGQSFQTCGPLAIFPRKSVPGEFQKPLDKIGLKIQRSINLVRTEQTTSISGNRKRITARYKCPDPSEGDVSEPEASTGVSTITLSKTRARAAKAAIKYC